jgi:hypothetical protein
MVSLPALSTAEGSNHRRQGPLILACRRASGHFFSALLVS